MHILSIEPNRHFEQILESCVNHLGHKLDSFDAADKAFRALRKKDYGLITITRHLDAGDYQPVVRRIRDMESYQFTPILLMSSDSQENLFIEAMSCGVTDVLDKTDPQAILNGLRRSLRMSDFRFAGRALLLEDNRASGGLLKAQLESCGMTVDWFDNFEPARQAINEHDYDLALVDVVLDSNHTGLQLIHEQRIAADSRNKDVPVIAITGFNDSARRIMAYHLGVDDYLTKPVHQEELFVRLERVLSRSRLNQRLQQRDSLLNDLGLIDNVTTLYNQAGLKAATKAAEAGHAQAISIALQGELKAENLPLFSEALQLHLGSRDICARWDEQQFVIIVPAAESKEIDALEEQLSNFFAGRYSNIRVAINTFELIPGCYSEQLRQSLA